MKKRIDNTRSTMLRVFPILLFIILASSFKFAGCSEKKSETRPLVLVKGMMIDGTGNDAIPDAVLVLREDRIVAAGTAQAVGIPEDAEVVDLNGATILPGFINTHVHAGYDAENLRAFAQAGVTTVRDLADGRMDWQWFARRDELLEDPLNARLIAVGPMVSVPDGYPVPFTNEEVLAITSPEQARQEIQRLIDAGADVIKIAVETGEVFMTELPTLSTEEVEAIVSVAHRNNIDVVAHITHSQDIPTFLEGGGDEIAHMVLDDLSDDLIEQLVAADVYWGPTLELWYHVQQIYEHQMPGFQSYLPAVENLRRFVEAGGNAVLGTDFAGFEEGQFELGMPMIEIESMLMADMTPMQVVVAATKNAAYVCNREEDLGTLEAGKIADILVVRGNPLEDIRALKNPVLVVHNGIIIRNGL